MRLARVASGSILPRVLTALTRWQRSASIPEPLTEPGQFGGGQGCDEAVEAIGFVINCTGFCTGLLATSEVSLGIHEDCALPVGGTAAGLRTINRPRI